MLQSLNVNACPVGNDNRGCNHGHFGLVDESAKEAGNRVGYPARYGCNAGSFSDTSIDMLLSSILRTRIAVVSWLCLGLETVGAGRRRIEKEAPGAAMGCEITRDESHRISAVPQQVETKTVIGKGISKKRADTMAFREVREKKGDSLQMGCLLLLYGRKDAVFSRWNLMGRRIKDAILVEV